MRQTTKDLRRHNRAALLSELYLRGPVSRLELAAESGLSAATVTNVVADLIGDGVVAEAGSVVSDGGRPRTLLRVRPEFGHVIGVDVGETHLEVGLFDCTLGPLATARFPLDALDPAEVTRLTCAGVAEVLADVDPAGLFGIGVGSPGAVLDGLVHAPTLGWPGVPFAEMLRAGGLPDVPLHLDNRARTLGQAEMWRGAGRGAERVIVALLGVGVGAAFASGGVWFPGITTSEWGHTVIQAGGTPCRCGSRGCLEAYVGIAAVLGRHPGELPGEDDEAQLAALVEAAKSPGPAVGTLAETGEYLGIGIANLVNLLSPDRVVLAGSAGAIMGPALLPAVRDAIGRHALEYLAGGTEVVLGAFGHEGVALGAATLPVAELLSRGGAPRRR